MTAFPSPETGVSYPPKTLQRADRAARCAPFQLCLYETMQREGVSLKAIANQAGVQHRYTQRPISELAAENDLLWLMQVGLLRREVDGQGLTDSFRITPLGRQLVQRWQRIGIIPAPSLVLRLRNWLTRWIRFPGIQ